jgi:hypothetical protein
MKLDDRASSLREDARRVPTTTWGRTLTTYTIDGVGDRAAATAVLNALEAVESILTSDVWLDAREINVVTALPVPEAEARTAICGAGFRLLNSRSRSILDAPRSTAT